MAGGSPVTANDILQNQGNSVFAGGLGPNWQSINGNGLSSQIAEASKMLQVQSIAKQQREYKRKTDQVNEFASLIDKGELDTTEMDDEERLQLGEKTRAYKDKLMSSFKKGPIKDQDYLELHKEYADLKNQITRAKVNYRAMQADINAESNPYDKESGKTKSVSTSSINDKGEKVVSTEQEFGANIRNSSENKTGLQKHRETYLEEKKKNPYAMYKPYVPILPVKDSEVFLPVQVDEEKQYSKDGLKVQVETKPNLTKTINQYLKLATNPDANDKLKRKYQQITSDIAEGGVGGMTMIQATNKKLEEIKAKEGITEPLEITPETNYLTAMALISYAQGYDNSFGKSSKYVDKNAEKKDLEKFKTGEVVVRDNNKAANQIKTIKARESSTIRTQNNNALNQQKLEKIKHPDTKKGEDGVYYQDAMNKVKEISTKGKVLEADEVEKKFDKSKGLGKSGIKKEEVQSVREVDHAGLSKNLKTYFKASQKVYVVTKKDGTTEFVDTGGNRFSEDDLAKVAAGESKGAKKEFLERESSNQSTRTPVQKEPTAPKKVNKIKKSAKEYGL